MSTVVVVGGGIVGTSTALQLAEADSAVEIVLVEPDPSFTHAATGKGTGGIRQLFTRPENILLSQHTLDVVEHWSDWAVGPETSAPDLRWHPNGYLFVAGSDDVTQLEINYRTQVAHGVSAEWLDPNELGSRFPEIRVDDLAGAVLSPRDGWLDPTAFFAGIQAKAAAAGVSTVKDRVTELVVMDRHVRGVRLAETGLVRADVIVNAAGTRAPDLVAPLGMRLPVEPMRRHEHLVSVDRSADHLPFIKDVRGLAVHAHEGGFSVGLVDFEHPGGHDVSVDPMYFDRVVAPAIAHRLSGLTRFSEQRTWTGLYDQNRLDGNAIVGNWPGRHDNVYVATGFSGHGFMHALGIGRALSEHILTGDYQTIDLTRFGYHRVERNEPYAERGVR